MLRRSLLAMAAAATFVPRGIAAIPGIAYGPVATRPRINVLDFGAAADGRDCTAALRRAIDRARAVGGEVWVPAGSYRIELFTRV
jgi:polygalacturonase